MGVLKNGSAEQGKKSKTIFNMSVKDFEEMLEIYFNIEKKEEVGPMIQYLLVVKSRVMQPQNVKCYMLEKETK